MIFPNVAPNVEPDVDRGLEGQTPSTSSDPRLRLIGSRLERGPAGMSRVVVEFRRTGDDALLCGRQEGTTCPGGDLRLAALATLAILREAVQGALGLELIGVKPVRAFDTTVMMVAATVKQDGRSVRVVGAAIADGNDIDATVRATLHAVNRLVSPILGPIPLSD